MAGPHLAIYTGSFDPITLGHLDLLQRSRGLFDEVILAIGHNPDKSQLFSAAERYEMARILVADLLQRHPQGARVRAEAYTGLTVDFARAVGATAILRGIRNVTDLAAETQLAITNRHIADIETVFMVTGEAYAFTSSSLIKQIVALGGSLDSLRSIVPPLVLERLRARRRVTDDPLTQLAHDDLVK